QDLLDQLLAHWQATNTAAIVERAERAAATPCRSVLHVFECWVREEYFNPRLDIAIRDWARKSEVARRAVDRADEERVRALTRMFERHGYGAPEAFIRARVLYYMQIGYYSLAIEEPMETRLGYVAHYLRVFTGMEPSEKEIADFRAFLSEVRDLDEPLPMVPESRPAPTAATRRRRPAKSSRVAAQRPLDCRAPLRLLAVTLVVGLR